MKETTMKKIRLPALLIGLLVTSAFAQTPTAPAAPTAPATPSAPAAIAPTAPAGAPATAAKNESKKDAVAAGDVATGKAAWYGNKFNGRKTASGQRFNAGALTAASNTLPFGTLVRVTNLKNKKSVVVRINDRGPQQADRIIDVSRAAAARLGMLRSGLAEVELKVVGQAKGKKAMKKKA
jgi:rare lipoprotein A